MDNAALFRWNDLLTRAQTDAQAKLGFTFTSTRIADGCIMFRNVDGTVIATVTLEEEQAFLMGMQAILNRLP